MAYFLMAMDGPPVTVNEKIHHFIQTEKPCIYRNYLRFDFFALTDSYLLVISHIS